tara:strand:- start:6009 stop:7031 length:1023 start_codon:yes stop_codon:yes gene_type:complete
MSVGSIYKIVFPNGKHYIGLTSRSLEDRQKEHKWSVKSGNYNNLVYRALTKYEMVDTFELVEIDTADTLEELCEKEIGYIQEYNSYYMDGNGYNMTLGGEGFNGYIRTEEDNRKNSERGKQYYIDNPEAGKEHGERMKQYYIDNPEEKEKQGARMKQIYKDNPQVKQNMSEGQTKRFENPEEIGKISIAAKKRFTKQGEKEAHCIRMKERYETHPEMAKIHSEKMKQRYIDNPEAGKEHGEIMKQYYIDNPEELQKMSERGKQYYIDNPDYKYKRLDTQGQNKPFDIFKIDGTFVKTFNYQCDAIKYLQKEHNITSTIKIGAVLNGNRNNSAGFVFKYQE